MKARNDVMMSLSPFAQAGRAIAQRATRIRLVQPTLTFLYAEGQTFVVDTPTGAEKIAMTGAWEATLVIDAKFFAALCGKLGSGLTVRLVYSAGRLFINGAGVPVAEVERRKRRA